MDDIELPEDSEDDSFNDELPEEDDDWGDEDDDWGDDGDAFDDGFEDDPTIESKQDFIVLDETELKNRKDKLVNDLAETLAISPLKSSMLMRANKWNQERIVTEYFEDSQKLLKNGGLQFLEKKCESKDEEIECRICDDDFPLEETLAIGCGHRFCEDCWKDYLEERTNRGVSNVLSPCPSYKCPAVVPDTLFEKVLDEEDYKKYQHLIVRSFVEDSRTLRWCPAPRCDSAVEAFSQITTVLCRCGFKFCFRCHEEDHQPITCDNLQLWKDKCQNESETAHWIIANTKKCPKCLVRIEKNQGCNHMTCKHCKHEFCWVCMGDWAEHGNHTGGYYKCNKYDPKKKKTKGSAEDEAKAELDRYLHYYQRYHNHDQSKRFAARQLESTEKRMQKLQQKGSASTTWMDVQFLKQATDQVFECRRVLKYTYAFAFYLEDGEEKVLFEYLQEQLERSTEHLSELSEMPLEKLNRTEVVNFQRVTAQFMKGLLDGVADGLTSKVSKDT